MSDFECHVREGLEEYERRDWRKACKGLDYYHEHEGNGYCVLHFPSQDKEDDFERVLESKLVQKDYNLSGTVFPEGTSTFFEFVFDATAYFRGATFVGDADFSFARFSGEWTDFMEAQFSGQRTDFGNAQFSGEVTNFRNAQFSGEKTDFVGTQFSGRETDFGGAQFSGEETVFVGANFSGERTGFGNTQFSSEETDFREAQFGSEETDFSLAQFGGKTTLFLGTQFSSESTTFLAAQFSGAETSFGHKAIFRKEVDFGGAIFKEQIVFSGLKGHPLFGSEAWAQFNSVRIEKPELLRFGSVLLHPGWFINTDVRKVDFTDVKWYGMPSGPQGSLNEEIAALRRHRVESPHTLLAQACRRLSANAEENREYPLANEFHYWSMDALRKESWHYRKETWDGLAWIRKNWLRVAKRCSPETTLRLVWDRIRRRSQGRPRNLGLIITLYWVLSGYGVRAARAFLVLVGICAAFAALYMVLGPPKLQDIGQAVVYSLGAVARLNPEPKPNEPGLFQFLVITEGLLGPLQIGLLLLAIRRKVMR